MKSQGRKASSGRDDFAPKETPYANADASDRASANKGLTLIREKLAKYLKRKIMDDQKKFVSMGATVAEKR